MNWRVSVRTTRTTTSVGWRESKQPVTLNETTRGLSLLTEGLKLLFQGKGALTMPAGIAHGFVKTRPELETPDVQYHCAHASFADPHKRILDDFPGMSLGPCQLRPESRGTVHITSDDHRDRPVIKPNFLKEELDRETHVAGLKIARDILERPALDAYRDVEFVPGPDCRTDDELLDHARRVGGMGVSLQLVPADGQRPDGRGR